MGSGAIAGSEWLCQPDLQLRADCALFAGSPRCRSRAGQGQARGLERAAPPAGWSERARASSAAFTPEPRGEGAGKRGPEAPRGGPPRCEGRRAVRGAARARWAPEWVAGQALRVRVGAVLLQHRPRREQLGEPRGPPAPVARPIQVRIHTKSTRSRNLGTLTP